MAPPRRPTTRGRTPAGSRAPIRISPVRATSEYAPDDLAQGVDQAVDDVPEGARRDEVDQHLGVAGGLEDRARGDQPLAQADAVGEVAVVRHRQAAKGELREQRLDVAQHRAAAGGIAVVPDRGRSLEAVDHVLGAEVLRDLAEKALGMELPAAEGHDAGRFLAAVLQRVQAEHGVGGSLLVAGDAEHPAFVVEAIVRGPGGGRARRRRRDHCSPLRINCCIPLRSRAP